ncbi:14206_t:CDS:2, partial [Racocetra fulgida]
DQYKMCFAYEWEKRWQKRSEKVLRKIEANFTDNNNRKCQIVESEIDVYVNKLDRYDEFDNLLLKTLPKKFSTENNMDSDNVPEELQGLTEIEEISFIQRVSSCSQNSIEIEENKALATNVINYQ